MLKLLNRLLSGVFEFLAQDRLWRVFSLCWSRVMSNRYRLGLSLLWWIFHEGLSLAGGPDNQVHFEGYQVSNQCMALVRDECLLPCKDAPELGYAKESSSEQYVPDVFYKVKTPWCRENCGWGIAEC